MRLGYPILFLVFVAFCALFIVSLIQYKNGIPCRTLCKQYDYGTKCQVPHQIDESPFAIVSLPLDISNSTFEVVYFRGEPCDIRTGSEFSKSEGYYGVWMMGVATGGTLSFAIFVFSIFGAFAWVNKIRCCERKEGYVSA